MLLGLDIGTSSCKTTLFDPETGRTFPGSKRPLDFSFSSDGGAELDADYLWETVLLCLSDLGASNPGACSKIQALGISVFFSTLLPVDSAYSPLRPAILYNDLRSQSQVDDLNSEAGYEHLEKLTGNRLCPGTSVLPGIRWIGEHEPEVASRTACYTQLGEYIGWKLGGGHGLDTSQASLSALCSAGKEEKWCDELTKLAGIDPGKLPPLCKSLTVTGTLSSALSKRCRIPEGIPIVCASGDAPMAALGGGVCGPGQVFAAVGSTDCLVFSGPRPSGNPLFCNVRHVIPDSWLAIGTMSSAGAAVKWFCDSFMHCSCDEMTKWASEAPSGSGGVIFLPYLQGERTPHWNSKLRGSYHGLGLSTSRSEAARSVFEGVACGWRQILTLLEDEYGFKPESVVCAGGGSGNYLWNQIKASMLQRPIRVLHHPEVSSLGACMAAGLGAGIFKDANDAMEATAALRETDIIEPVKEWQDSLSDIFYRYVTLYRN